MGIISFVKSLHSVKASPIYNPGTGFSGFSMLNKKHAGVTVTPQVALAHDTVYACIRDKAESIGQLPVNLYKKGKKQLSGREVRIFTKQPNDFQTIQELLEMYESCLELYGNFYALVVRNDLGSIYEILPFIDQQSVRPDVDLNGNVYYRYVTNDHKIGMEFAGGDIIHIKLNSVNGFVGMSAISYGARSIGVAISQEVHLASVMEDGALPSGVLEMEGTFSDQAAIDRFQKDWREKYGGAMNSGKTPMLEYGLKYKPLQISPADAELILQRQFSREQICALLRVPVDRVGGASSAKQKDVEQSNTAYMRDSLMPLITKFENAINLKLPAGTEIRIDEKGFIRGDRKSQVEVLSAEFKTGAISMNELRKGMDREPIEGGDYHAIDTNNFTFGALTDIPKLQEEARALAMAGAQKPNDKPDDEPESSDDE